MGGRESGIERVNGKEEGSARRGISVRMVHRE